MAELVDNGKFMEAGIVEDGALAALSRDRLRILRAFAEEPKYPAEVAKLLGIQAQTVYYHVRQLLNAGLIRLVDYEARGGALAKRFSCPHSALAVTLRSDWKPFVHEVEKTPSFLKPFVESGRLDAKIVVGSPEPHGRYRSRGSEFCAVELAAWLGRYAVFDYPLYYLDTELKDRRQNLFLVGGPKVNTVLDEVNPKLPVRFEDKSFNVYSSVSKKTYSDPVGVVETAENPLNPRRRVFIVAGSNHDATRVAILALLRQPRRIAAGNAFDAEVTAKVVQGFDEDGDGIVDAVEFLE
ncbi:hypothetical protein COX86_01665 [Candidatus Micrarchaeota archaeon CG_4_10_14_0_2_um_filter_60_11]|nr:MAG: hypothetical protein AUJ16_00980 [Candidatus Micrarchaeota archaeon CG1_02_60_51]PIN96103.1 MAG: hypothetical protein COU39_02810 [Candidatus Micrarchaeota archaeon CG10_big_fil_rev_8_21_14_0_10_60_32]PIO01609.1 MAG: hypothetical protein COT58_04430 [Candidatus Micrarchaeota archaeon CG09_land_8_20_14_0_10_60_16]PIY91846.1 MAG: hypothetical protein COY71_00970 [Candidatus Micrarchaeota archaeon CG_4_10_14_0_8_um_filter_60_7]PIZ91053.1 MAG: hypothetical protein COX86_01665 [Candidatus Mi